MVINEFYPEGHKDRRIIVEYDTWPENPLEFFDSYGYVSIYSISSRRDYFQPDSGDNSFGKVLDYLKSGPKAFRIAVPEFFDLINTAFSIVDLDSGSYVFYAEEQKDVTPQEDIDEVVRRYKDWARGEVYIVSFQERTIWENIYGLKMETWEDLESVNCVYGDVDNLDFLKEVLGEE